MQQLEQRLEILVHGGVVSAEAARVTLTACDRLQNKSTRTLNLEKLQMLATHLATALTRISRKDGLTTGLTAESLAELRCSPCMEAAEEEIDWLSQTWNDSIPDVEKEYLRLHYVSILQDMDESGDA
ncbi:PRD domain-containing protein [Paenactinomyces guangxiensis]|uniref:PRD domain-containing protein n=1 Tax=Paenactinomyces guangxiensis TaxID=1490290 RepID=A0A7W2A7W4_9BACL|nr:PRD domain-containing protein [Paenactinomyces guangxiensis]MBA4493218.1 PRD domain-containing protein [Paenactinomyces guangxiensis]MBH8589932.1 PRD domain-containing protein [Paenactinomyces guangxiensis]